MSERALWRAVISQTILDSTINIPTGKKYEETQKNSARNIKSQAQDWLNMNNKDFRCVCDLADINPMRMLKLYQKWLEKGSKQFKRHYI